MSSVFTFLLRKRLFFLLGVGCILLNLQSVKATHLMGGDLTYQCVGGNTFQFTLTLYRDCRGIPLSTNNQRIVMFSNSCGIQESNINLNFQSFQEITPICPAQQANSACNGGPVPGVEEYIFTATVTLPQQCTDWTFYYVRCCRNGAITNLVNPNGQRIYIEATLNNVAVTCNSSPIFTNKPVPFLCDGSPFLYNNGAIDPDGDSLAFMLIPPRNKSSNNPPNDINFSGNFSPPYPLTTAPANAFNFDQLSGQMDFTPSGLQQAVVTVLVKEYRNGVLIGTVLRDIQLVVINCANQAPQLDPPSNITGGTLNGNTFSVCAGNTLSFDLVANDPDVGNSLTFDSDVLQALAGASFSQTFGNPNTASISWPTTVNDTGTYFISFLLYDDGCPLIASQVVGFNIIVGAGEIYPPQNNYICPSTTNNLPLQSSIPNTGAGVYQWSPANGLSNPNIANPVATLPPSATATYYVTYTGGVCPAIEEVNILPSGLVSAPDTVQICEGDSAALTASFQQFGANNPFTYTWDPPLGLSNAAIGNPMASPANTTTYTVTASTINCAFAADVVVEVIPLPDLTNIPSDSICQNDSIQLFPAGNNLQGATYSWSPVVGISNPNLFSPNVSPNNTQVYTLTATNQCGSDTETATVTVFDPFSVSLNAQDVNCNGGNDGAITAIVNGGNGNPQYLWTPGGATTSAISNLPVGTYSVNLSDAAGCDASASVTLSEPPALMGMVTNSNNIDCFGANTGSFSLGASGGTPPYKFSVNAGPFQSNINYNNTPPGTYTLRVQDANFCEEIFGPVNISQPNSAVAINLVSTIPAGCNGVLGEIVVNASGGTPPYQFTLNGGAPQPGTLFGSLTSGTYILGVMDANGCVDDISVDIFSITDPVIVLDSIGPVSCSGDSDGLIRVSNSGGVGPYVVAIDGGPLASDTLFTGLT
ncbi:MAG: SprB repeat-containing protein, partial [Bacteroidota bacterium]